MIELRNIVEQRKGQRSLLKENIRITQAAIKTTSNEIAVLKRAREIIRIVGMQLQSRVQLQISNLTTTALKAILPNPYEFVAEFVLRRNKSECDLYFKRDGNRIDPLRSSGGGAVDVAAFTLKIASLLLKRTRDPKRAKVLLFDEPLKFLSVDRHETASEMISEISAQLDLQIIMVTHCKGLIQCANRWFHVFQHNGIAKVKQLS